MGTDVPDPNPGAARRRPSIDCKTFLREHTGKLSDHYEVIGDLGEGGFGDVWLARELVRVATPHERAGRSVAVKRVRKPNPEAGLDEEGADSEEALESFRTEVELMKSLDHPNICRLLQVFEDAKNIYLVMERMEGGELFDRIVSWGSFGEEDAAHVMAQVASALAYCHHRGIVHRDIKPENILLVNDESDDSAPMTVKVIDFGFGSRILKDASRRLGAAGAVGTLAYSAPEVLAGGPSDEKVDLWSLGCVLYVMLSGNEPFFGQRARGKIAQGLFSMGGEDWADVSEEAKALVTALLTVEPKRRLSAVEVLGHRWLLQNKPQARPAGKSVLKHLHHLKQFHSDSLFRKFCAGVVARQLDESLLCSLRETFSRFDKTGDGIITLAEFKECWRCLDLEEPDAAGTDSPETHTSMTSADTTRASMMLRARFSTIDMDGNGVIDYTEFLAACLDRRVRDQEEVCWAAFRVFDVDGNGVVTYDEFQQVLSSADMQNTFSPDVLRQLWQELTAAGDEAVDFDRFLAALRGVQGQAAASESCSLEGSFSDASAPPPTVRRQSGPCICAPESGPDTPVQKRQTASCVALPGTGLPGLPIRSRGAAAPEAGLPGLPIPSRQAAPDSSAGASLGLPIPSRQAASPGAGLPIPGRQAAPGAESPSLPIPGRQAALDSAAASPGLPIPSRQAAAPGAGSASPVLPIGSRQDAPSGGLPVLPIPGRQARLDSSE